MRPIVRETSLRGIEDPVEDVLRTGGVAGVITARVVRTERHPDAAKVIRVWVDAGDGVDRADATLEHGALHERKRLRHVVQAQDARALLAGDAGGGILDDGSGEDGFGADEAPPGDLVGADAGRTMRRGADGTQGRFAVAALRGRDRAARDERARVREVDEQRRRALDRCERLTPRRVDAGHGPEQADRVRHPRCGEDVVRRPRLDEAAGVHDADTVGLTGDDYRDPAVFDAAYGSAMVACAVLLVLGGVVSWLAIPRRVVQPLPKV